MSSLTGFYNYNTTFYTGTDIQPDSFSVIIKPANQQISHVKFNWALANWMGYLPVVSMVSGAARIVAAVKEIFKILSDDVTPKSELWNAFKNIFRGIVEFIPFTGITLILFDTFRFAIQLTQIANDLKDKENIAAVAIDGKVVMTLDLNKVDEFITKRIPNPDSKLNEYRLKYINQTCIQMLKNAEEKNLKIGMTEIFTSAAKPKVEPDVIEV